MLIKWKFILKNTLLFSILAFFIWLSFITLTKLHPYILNPICNDWCDVYGRAVDDIFSGENPYINEITINNKYVEGGFFNPPWTLIPLLPLTLFSNVVASWILKFLNVGIIAFVAYRKGASSAAIILLMTLPHLWIGDIDWMVVLGLILPRWLGLFFVLTKPQLGAFVAFFWLIESFRQGSFREVGKVFSPVLLSLLLSFLIFGFWPLRMLNIQSASSNISIWPYALPVGLILLLKAIKERSENEAILSPPFLVPYISVQSLPYSLIGLLPSRIYFVAGIVSVWFVWLLRGPV
jgi:hypothetical protein